MKKTTVVADALDGISKAFYVTGDNGTSTIALDIQVQWSSKLPDHVLDLVQDRLQKMYVEVMDALQDPSKEISE